jgi:hypothetical protein
MRRLVNYLVIPCAVVGGYGLTASLTTAVSAAGNNTIAQRAAPSGPDEPATRLKPNLPQLKLSDMQRRKIRQAVMGEDTEVTFQLKTTKPLKDFKPAVGVKIPLHLPTHALPSRLASEFPILKNYKYTKVKGEVLIVNPMTKDVVDMFPEAPS